MAIYVVLETLPGKLMYDLTIKRTYQIGHVSLNVSLNLTIIHLFKTRDDVYFCLYAIVRFHVLHVSTSIEN